MSSSPTPPPRAVQLLQRVQARSSEASDPTVPHQHVVSQSVLRRFTVPVPGNDQCLLYFNLLRDPVVSRRSAPKGVGAVEDFVPFASASMEEFWGRMETDFSEAFKAIDDGSLFTRSDLLSVVRDLLAMHYVRSEQVKQQHFDSFDAALAEAKDFWHRSPQDGLLLQLYRAHTGDTGPDKEALESAVDMLYRDTVDLVTSGQMLRQRMEDMFTLVRAALDSFNVEIWTPQAGAGEFLIADAPAVTFDHQTGYVGLGAGIGLLGLDVSLYMPLGPEHMAWVHRGPGDGFHKVGQGAIDKANAVQVLDAQKYVYARLGSSFETFAGRVHKARCF
jgi:hypothetical protein